MKSVIIFGLGPAGLFLSRELAKNDVHTIGIGRKDDVGLYSKYVDPFVAETKVEVMKAISKIRVRHSGPLIGYICSDQYLTLLLNNCPEVFEIINFVGVRKENYELINNKQKITELCTELGLRTPRNYSYQDLLNNKVEFPIAFKLNTKEINSKKNPIGKLKIIKNEKELNNLEKDISISQIEKDKIVIQEYIEGNNNHQFSFGGYFINGVKKAGIVVNQIGQYPQGVSSLVLEAEEGEIKNKINESVIRFAGHLKYTGFLELEFKVSKELIYLMDINPRTWGWVSILAKKYPDFHNVLCINNKIPINKISELVMWKSPMRIFMGNLKNPLNEKKVAKRLKKYKKSNIAYDLYDSRDPKPVFAILQVSAKKLKKKFR